jgi:hypothetical protein
VDNNHRKRYSLGILPPRFTPKSAYGESGFLTKAESIDEIATKIGIDSAGLSETVARFNDMAHKGVDEDFVRGDSPYERVYSDPKIKPNPNLGPIEVPPFYVAKMYPAI